MKTITLLICVSLFSLTSVFSQGTLEVRGNNQIISNGDTTPSTTDDTDFGNVLIGNNNSNTFVLDNTANGGNSNKRLDNIKVTITGSTDFSPTTANLGNLVGNGGTISHIITFTPTITGTQTATVTITFTNGTNSGYSFNITGNGVSPLPEIDIKGLGNSISSGDSTPNVSDNTDFGVTNVTTGTITKTFTLENNGNSNLNLTDPFPYISITGSNAADFSITTAPNNTISSASSTNFVVSFTPSASGIRTATLSIANNDSDENPYTFAIQGEGVIPTFSYTTVSVNWPQFASENSVYIYAPDGTLIESIIGNGSNYSETISLGCIEDLNEYYFIMYDDYGDGWNGIDNITITASGVEVINQNGDAASSTGTVVNFNVSGGVCGNEINIVSNNTDILDDSTTPSVFNNTDFGTVDTGTSVTRTFTIENLGGETLNLTSWFSPYITITGPALLDFTITSAPSNSIPAGGSTTFEITFNPIAGGLRTATVTINNDDADESPYNFTIQGIGIAPLTEGPGGVTDNLKLWLKSTDGLGYSDGQGVSAWYDQGRGSNATVHTPGQEPTYKDNTIDNINFNPVIEFDNNFSSYTTDGDYSFDNTTTQFLQGPSGFYTQDLFIVIIADDTPVNSTFGFMDVICGDSNPNSDATDTTGIGFGDFTSRIDGESISFALDTYTQSEVGDGYAVYDDSSRSYTNVGIINTRNNTATTQQELFYNANNIETAQNDVAEFLNVNDSRFFIGRSEGWEATLNARVAEVITFSSRLSDSDLTDQRNRVQSYLAVKYGITLGVNGTSQDYVDSDGTVIWDQSNNIGFNYDIAGIGRDDDANLNQKQSSSINNATDANGPTEGILTIGLTDIYATNNINKTSNPNTLDDKSYLMWGNNNASLDAEPNTVAVDISSGIAGLSTPVSFLGMQRIWKVVENGSDIGHVKVSIPQNAIRNINPPGKYYMFASDTPIFDPTADYRIMTHNGGNLEAIYDFDGTKYITFGYAPEVTVERSVYFDGAADYIDMDDNFDLNSGPFTISAWVNRTASSTNSSILSKRNFFFTEGYDLKINATGKLEFTVNNGGFPETVTSNTTIPVGKWHQVAVIFDGTNANLYIDGVFDNDGTISSPPNTDQSFYIAAAGKTTPTSFFQGNIDEVRIWSTALEEDQLQFLMNQELEENTNFVNGKVVPTTITKNDAADIPWSKLEGYYPMSVYSYTNTNDESDYDRQGALRNLNTVDFQTAPLPYQSTTNGDWDTNSSWLNGTEQYIPGSASIVDNTKTINWNIVETSHNITIDNSTLPATNNDNRQVLSLNVKANILTVSGDNSLQLGNGLTVSHYLKIDGKIDLQGESQLIQTTDSDFDPSSIGVLERDQQGTKDLFTYNFWSSPVGVSNNTTNNNAYTLPQVFKDGTDPNNPVNINFITNSYNGTDGTPIGIADYWIWKYSNQSGAYADWQHVRSSGTLLTGEGFTLKGVTNTNNNLALEQNYVFEGKPNNGDITLPITSGNEYLVGNPYASAIDANQFIMDNAPTIEGPGSTTGTLYFWEHWGGGSHILAEYQGGYATYNLSGATPAASYGTNDPLVATGGTPVKLPGRYIPVSQGFFVKSENTGNIRFNNGQRIFEKEGSASSVFVRNSAQAATTNNADNRLKIRLGFNSVNSIHRQLLVTEDSNATSGYDWGYDGATKSEQMDDIYWMIESNKYTIQGTNAINPATILPIGLHVDNDGINTFTIDALENVPDYLEIYIFDNVTGTYHDLRQGDASITLTSGIYLDRFDLRFSQINFLSTEDFDFETTINFYFGNSNNTIVVNNPKLEVIKSITLYNLLGQKIIAFNEFENQELIELKTNTISTGTYILEVKTDEGKLSKKVLVE